MSLVTVDADLGILLFRSSTITPEELTTMDKADPEKQPKITIKFDPKTREIAVNRVPEYAGFKKQR